MVVAVFLLKEDTTLSIHIRSIFFPSLLTNYLLLPTSPLYYLLATPLSKDGTSLDFLASAKDHRGKGVGSTLAE